MNIRHIKSIAILLSLGLTACGDPVPLQGASVMDVGNATVINNPEVIVDQGPPAGAIPADSQPSVATDPVGTDTAVDSPSGQTPTDPEPTEPEPTDPEPTEPEPTDPEPTDPDAEPTDPDVTGPTDVPAVVNDDWWKPKASDNLTWQWQLQGEIDVTLPVDVYNVDIEIPQYKLDQLIDRGVKVICYFSAGTVEYFRSDSRRFPQDIIGEQYEDLVDEKWVDYADIDALAPIMRARLDKCKSKGFHAVEIDNVDAHNYESRDENGEVVNIGTNFNMTLDESIAYVRWLADEAHSRGLSIGLKNAEEMVPDVVDDVDWMLVEDCYYDSWCQYATGFIDANKPVFMAEYDDLVPDFAPACELAKSLGFSAIWREPSLSDGLYLACE